MLNRCVINSGWLINSLSISLPFSLSLSLSHSLSLSLSPSLSLSLSPSLSLSLSLSLNDKLADIKLCWVLYFVVLYFTYSFYYLFILLLYSFTDNRFFVVLIRKYIFCFYPSFKLSIVFSSEKPMIRGDLQLLL